MRDRDELPNGVNKRVPRRLYEVGVKDGIAEVKYLEYTAHKITQRLRDALKQIRD